jgi:molybdate transport system substrate-binding protein
VAGAAAKHRLSLLREQFVDVPVRAFLVACIAVLFSATSVANPLRVAVAANFKSTLVTLTTAYADQEIDIIAGSTGMLYSQIRHGAPFDLFLAADSLHPQLLEQANLALSGSRFTYAVGQLVFWVPKHAGTVDQPLFLAFDDAIAVANPKLAPYGQAAMVLIDKFKPEHKALIYGNNVNQTFQFIDSGNVAAGFISLAQVKGRSPAASWWLAPTSEYPAIEQQAIVLKNHQPGAEEFALFLQSERARRIITDAGYRTAVAL